MTRDDAARGPAWVGRPIERQEDERLLTGRGCFVDDVDRPGLLHAAVLRSPYAHALVRGIDPGGARALPGVAAVYTHADLGTADRAIPIRLAPLEGLERFLQRPLAADRVRYAGEPVALVVAASRYLAEDALEAIEVAYEPQPPVATIADALAGASLPHPAAGTNVGCRYRASRGDPDAAFASAAYRRRERFRCHRHTAVPLETRGLVAEFDAARGRLRVWGAAKVTYFNRRVLAGVLGLDEARVELIEVDVGASFGVRGELYPEDILVPFAAMRLGRPVKWIEDRREHLLATNHSREIECELEIACAADGRVLGLRGLVAADLGAYARTNGGVVPAKAAQFLPGPYRIDHVAVEVVALMTNKTPVGTYRGPGRYEANFFRERLLDLAAADLGLDPAELRRRNLLRPADLPYPLGPLVPYEDDTAYDSGDYPLVFERALQAFDYAAAAARSGREIAGRRHGVGLGCFVESSGAGPAESARVTLRGAGRVEIATGLSALGQGQETTLAQIAADALDLPLGAFTVRHGTTGLVRWGYGTYHSRSMVMGGSAVLLACEALARRLVDHAARTLELERSMLVLRGGNVERRDRPGSPLLDLDGLAARAASGDAAVAELLAVEATFENRSRTYTYGLHLAEVAVDPATGAIEVLRFLAAEDIGRAVNPLLVHGQAIGAAVQGLGGATLDELVYDAEGQLLTGSFADYLLPIATDFPHVEALAFEHARSATNPLGVKGAGEGGIVAVGAALANAVAAALAPLGVQITELPLTPPRIVQAIRAAAATRCG